jgi:colanic acid biosynthesis glycosyl transferase WcaI
MLPMGWLRDKSAVARLLSWMLLRSLQRADRIVALDRFMKDRIQAKGIAPEKVLVVPPWSHDDHVRFDPAGREEFRDLYSLSGRFVVMHSGNHSPCHPLETLLQAAERLADHEDIVFCFIGGGSEFRKVQERAVARDMRNVRCFPYLPIEKLAASLSAADLQVVVMGNKYVGIIHPCKIYNVLAANRSFLSLALRTVTCRTSSAKWGAGHTLPGTATWRRLRQTSCRLYGAAQPFRRRFLKSGNGSRRTSSSRR